MKNDNKYLPNQIEAKWQEKWESDKTYSPDIQNAKKPFYNLMMFPYPSAEGLHVGNMYAFTGADVYGRFKRMQGNDVLEPIGLDGFGIHSENYALKVGRHPLEQSKLAEKNFYRQLKSIGNGFDLNRKLETYDPEYYKWTQWLFITLFKAGLAYRKKAEVNWCPSCLTVLSDEQVIDGKCERCGTEVEKKDLEQWFFRITDYAQRLLDNIEGLDWTERVKIAQRNWIGRSEGAEVEFEVEDDSNYVLLHGFTGSIKNDFFPWLIGKLDSEKVWAEDLPNSSDPSIEEQVEFVLKNAKFDENTVIFGHSLGSVVALKVLERLQKPVKRVVLAAGFAEPGFLDHERIFENKFDWKFDFEKIKKNAGEVVLLRASNDSAVPRERSEFIRSKIGGKIVDFEAKADHITGSEEPEILKALTSSLRVFTTRPDTLYGATFMVVSPEHELLSRIKSEEVKKYISEAKNKTDIERTGEGKEKSGVFSGLYAINPVNNKKIPVWVADYVLSSYGTGAIMAVPAHDERDFEFANKYDLEIKQVIEPESGIKNQELGEVYSGEGVIVNSEGWNGFHVPDDIGKVIDDLESRGLGNRKVNFHLRDWLISRQRYWGPPIPMIYCENCADQNMGEVEGMAGWYAEKEENLPIKLPEVSDWKPLGTGKAPLANHPEFYEVHCPECGNAARRETDVSDTFLDSSWYFLRYPSVKDEKGKMTDEKYQSTSEDKEKDQILHPSTFNFHLPWDPEVTRRWLPVDMYIGGAEHSVLHLLYSRFITMVLKDLGHLDFEEPFSKFYAHGLIIKDGAKMSKSKGNVVVPDAYIAKYGADSLRTYLMFLGPYSDGGDFRDSGIEGIFRFLKRVWRLMESGLRSKKQELSENEDSKELDRVMHKTIKGVTEDIENLRYNTAIAKLMEYYNDLNSFYTKYQILDTKYCKSYLLLLAPFAPHLTEELWSILGNKDSIHLSKWPDFDTEILSSDTFTIVVQVNGKRRAELTINKEQLTKNKEVEEMAKEAVNKYLQGQNIKKTIYVPGKILNFVI